RRLSGWGNFAPMGRNNQNRQIRLEPGNGVVSEEITLLDCFARRLSGLDGEGTDQATFRDADRLRVAGRQGGRCRPIQGIMNGRVTSCRTQSQLKLVGED